MSDNWPRYLTKDVDIIPEADAVDGYWITGSYSTVEQLTGEASFEVDLKLHSPKQNNGWVYMIWFQIIDPYLTNPSRNFYEGYSCAIRYTSGLGDDIPLNQIYTIGYRGVDKLNEAKNEHD